MVQLSPAMAQLRNEKRVLLRGTLVIRTKYCEKKSKYIGFWVYRRSYLIHSPVTVHDSTKNRGFLFVFGSLLNLKSHRQPELACPPRPRYPPSLPQSHATVCIEAVLSCLAQEHFSLAPPRPHKMRGYLPQRPLTSIGKVAKYQARRFRKYIPGYISGREWPFRESSLNYTLYIYI